MLRQLAVLLLILFAAAGLLFYSQTRDEPLKVSGFIEAHEIRVGSRVGGRVAEVHVAEGMDVSGGYFANGQEVPGKMLVSLEPFDLMERRGEAQAALRAKQQELKLLQDGYRQEEIDQAKARYDQLLRTLERLEAPPRPQEVKIAQAQLQVAKAQAELAAKTYERVAELLPTKAATQEDLDQAAEQVKSTRELVIVRSEELSLLLAGAREEDRAIARAQVAEALAAWQLKLDGYQAEQVAQAEAAVEAATAALQSVERQIEELQIHAPLDAGADAPRKYVVEAVEIRPGDLVAAGAPVLSLMDVDNLWVRAYVPENRLDLTIGQEVSVTVDSFPDRQYRGSVTYVNRQAEFTPSNVQTVEERSKQVFRIKVTLLEGIDQLRPGMAADVWLDEKPPGHEPPPQ